MVSNLSTVYERSMRLAAEQGELKGKLEVAKNLLADGMTIAKISEFTELSKHELEQHLNQQN